MKIKVGYGFTVMQQRVRVARKWAWHVLWIRTGNHRSPNELGKLINKFFWQVRWFRMGRRNHDREHGNVRKRELEQVGTVERKEKKKTIWDLRNSGGEECRVNNDEAMRREG